MVAMTAKKQTPMRRRDANINVSPRTDDMLDRIKHERNWDKRFIVERLVDWFEGLSEPEKFSVIYPSKPTDTPK
jgi:hypothetical protein